MDKTKDLRRGRSKDYRCGIAGFIFPVKCQTALEDGGLPLFQDDDSFSMMVLGNITTGAEFL